MVWNLLLFTLNSNVSHMNICKTIPHSFFNTGQTISQSISHISRLRIKINRSNFPDRRCGESPLLTAVKHDEESVIKLLLQCGAHLTTADSNVVMALLSLAARSGNIRMLESLRMAGANLGGCDELKQTPLHQVSGCSCWRGQWWMSLREWWITPRWIFEWWIILCD